MKKQARFIVIISGIIYVFCASVLASNSNSKKCKNDLPKALEEKNNAFSKLLKSKTNYNETIFKINKMKCGPKIPKGQCVSKSVEVINENTNKVRVQSIAKSDELTQKKLAEKCHFEMAPLLVNLNRNNIDLAKSRDTYNSKVAKVNALDCKERISPLQCISEKAKILIKLDKKKKTSYSSSKNYPITQKSDIECSGGSRLIIEYSIEKKDKNNSLDVNKKVCETYGESFISAEKISSLKNKIISDSIIIFNLGSPKKKHAEKKDPKICQKGLRHIKNNKGLSRDKN